MSDAEQTTAARPISGLPTVLPLPPLDAINNITFAISDEVAAHAMPGSGLAESIGALRTHLVAKHVRSGRRGLTVLAPDESAGASLLAINLAFSFAHAGIRTLIIDCDLRDPKMQDFVVPSAKVDGLRDLLESRVITIGSAIQVEIVPSLSVMFAGGAAPNASELVASPRLAQVLDICMRDFEATIVITPPSRSSADGRRIASLLRYAVVVARKDVTLLSEVKVLVDELRGDGVNVVGTVFNAD